MSKLLVTALVFLGSSNAFAHNTPFPHAEMHYEIAHFLVHALFALPIFIVAGVGYKVWQHYRSRNEQ
ncbi:hypothetical protein [Thiofilum flexile]|uniref:hypothetical protein n=1 Tax=Thiofilum flexile TaxID=125627 RepID=UPI00037099C5|nr:hypothetical protein [Thiofilum flexile]